MSTISNWQILQSPNLHITIFTFVSILPRWPMYDLLCKLEITHWLFIFFWLGRKYYQNKLEPFSSSSLRNVEHRLHLIFCFLFYHATSNDTFSKIFCLNFRLIFEITTKKIASWPDFTGKTQILSEKSHRAKFYELALPFFSCKSWQPHFPSFLISSKTAC